MFVDKLDDGTVPVEDVNVNPSDPLGECQGDCDDDDECEGDLVCFHNENGDAHVPPGCSGTGTADWDYCYVLSGKSSRSPLSDIL